jgi:hypothetical protein
MVVVLVIYVGIRRKNTASTTAETTARAGLIRAIENQIKMIEGVRNSNP